MSTGFDPYHRWLSIPPAEQPPTHYRLLGLQPFESDAEVIRSAFKRQAVHVRQFLESPLDPFAQNLLRELHVAEQCLTDRGAKAAYDGWLRGYAAALQTSATKSPLVSANRAPRPQVSPIPNVSTSAEVISSPQFKIQTAPSVNGGRSMRRNTSMFAGTMSLVLWLAGAAVGLTAGYAVLCMIDPGYDFLHVMFSDDQGAGGERSLASVNVAPPPQLANVVAPPTKPARKSPAASTRQNSLPADAARKTSAATPRIAVSTERPKSALSPRPRLEVQLPSALALPPTQQSTPAMFASFSAGSSVALNQHDLQLSLTQGSNRLLGTFELLPLPAEANSDRAWNVYWTPQGGGLVSNVGKFIASPSELQFAWADDPPRVAVAALRNSLLNLTIDGSGHRVALRLPDQRQKSKFSLARNRQVVLSDFDDPPELNQIRFELTDTSHLPPHQFDGKGRNGLSIGDQSAILYRDAPGMATRLAVVKRGRLPALELQTGYRLPSGFESVLTINQGQQKMLEMRGALANAQALRARLPGSRSAEVDATINVLQADIAALEKIARVAQQLHGARLPYRVYFDVEGEEVDLAIGQ